MSVAAVVLSVVEHCRLLVLFQRSFDARIAPVRLEPQVTDAPELAALHLVGSPLPSITLLVQE